MNVEECLREIRTRAAVLRYIASCGAINPEVPDPDVLAGVDSICTDIESLARAAHHALGVEALDVEIKRKR
jgi:hypothetical protein